MRPFSASTLRAINCLAARVRSLSGTCDGCHVFHFPRCLDDATSEDSGTATPQRSWLLQERGSQLSFVRIDKVNQPYVIVSQSFLQLLRACDNEIQKHVPSSSSFRINYPSIPIAVSGFIITVHIPL